MKIVVYGWYHQGNLGDELFMEAFTHLFPSYHFIFTNCITKKELEGADGVFFGGGSFLGDKPMVEPDAWELLQQKRILYLGVGTETEFHPTHQLLMKKARLIATRTPEYASKAAALNPNVMAIPDLVCCLPASPTRKQMTRSVLVLPNITVVPKWSDPQWKHAAWTYFKSEFAQCLDLLVEQGYNIDFLPMCINPELNDAHAAVELINATRYRGFRLLVHDKPANFQVAVDLMSSYDVIVTQRYHGIVLSDMIGASYVSLYHHDKLKNSAGDNLPYYGITKAQLKSSIEKQYSSKTSTLLPIDSNIFVDLKQRVDDALCRH